MKIFRHQHFFLLFLILSFSAFTNAQENQLNIGVQISKNPIDCNLYLLEKKEKFNLVFDEGRGINGVMLEIYLKRFSEQCPNSSFQIQAKEDLKWVLDMRAAHSLNIAKFYLQKSVEESKGGIMGAYSRLKIITEKYPQFSKMDEVLFLLIKTDLFLTKINKNQIEGKFEKAQKIYRRLLDEFPFSSYVCEANKLFQQGVK